MVDRLTPYSNDRVPDCRDVRLSQGVRTWPSRCGLASVGPSKRGKALLAGPDLVVTALDN